MAARKTRQPPVDRVQPPPESDAAPAAPYMEGVSASPTQRAWLWPAVLVFAVWFAVLVWLAVRFANPATLNREQIRNADLVVEATIENPATGQCRLIRSWPDAPQLEANIAVVGLGELSIDPGQSYLLPLTRNRRGPGFRITSTPVTLSKPLIYPADDESRRQLEEILGESHSDAPATDD